MAKVKTRRDRERKRVSARRRIEEHQSGSGSSCIRMPEGVNLFKVDRSGVRLIDVMPYIVKSSKYADEGEAYWEKTYWAHRSIGPNQEMVVCPAKTFDEKCPICEYRAKLTKDPTADEDLIGDLSPKQRQLFLLRDLKDADRGLQIFDVSFHNFGKLLDERIRSADEDEQEAWDGFADLQEGSSLRCSFVDDTFAGRTFQKCVAIDLKQRKTQYEDSDIEEHPCLDDILIVKSYDQLKRMFLQVEASNGKDEEEDEVSPRGRRAVKSKTKSKPKDEDDDEWEEEEEKPSKAKRGRAQDEDEDDEDEEEEAPKKRTAKKPPVKKETKALWKDDEDDEFEDDDEDEDDEEEERPSRSKSKAKSKAPSKSSKKKSEEDDWEEGFNSDEDDD